MLHQTKLPSSSSSSCSTFPCNPIFPSKLLTISTSPQVEKEQGMVRNFMPPSLKPCVLVEDFFVDDFLNLNNNNDDELEQPPLEVQQQPPQQQQQQQGGVDENDKETLFLSPPLDTAEEADLEWLSHFVEDSFCQCSTPFPPGYKPEPKPGSKPKPESISKPRELDTAAEVLTIPLSLGRSRRTKRARTGGRVWPTLLSTPPSSLVCRTHKNKNKKHRKVELGHGYGPRPGEGRRCSHCGVQKTPQWRLGPNGPKTLCNACGMRHISGRLLPEYRPACSPTFSGELHSNNHRKVLEMRKNKEVAKVGEVSHPVSSFG